MTATLRTFSPSPAVGINIRAILMIISTPQQQVLPRCQQNVTFQRVKWTKMPQPPIFFFCSHLVCIPIKQNNGQRFTSSLQTIEWYKNKSTSSCFVPCSALTGRGKPSFERGSGLTQAVTCESCYSNPFSWSAFQPVSEHTAQSSREVA